MINECAFGAEDDPDLSCEDIEALQSIEARSTCSSFVADVQLCQDGKQLFTTSNGRFGFGQAGIQESDNICIFNHALVAHTIRRVDDTDKEVYTLGGQAYIHGMMDGEIETLSLNEQDINFV